MSSSVAMRALEWALSRDTGTSSQALARHMIGLKTDSWCHPSDNGDLGRCIRLLDKVPEWRERIAEMGAVSAMWKALADNWAELERLYKADPNSKRLYERMKELTRAAEDATGRVVRMGGGASIIFPGR